jgi:hypothetical protein
VGNDTRGMTNRERYTLGGHAHLIPVIKVDPSAAHIVGWFWELRSFCAEWSAPIAPGMIADWSRLTANWPNATEADIILAMDRAYRSAMADFIRDRDARMTKGKGR